MENKSAAILAQEKKNDYQCKCRDFSVAPVIMKINDDGSLCRQLVHKKLNNLLTFPLLTLWRIRTSNRNVGKISFL